MYNKRARPDLAYIGIVAALFLIAALLVPRDELSRADRFLRGHFATTSSAHGDESIADYRRGLAALQLHDAARAQAAFQAGQNANPNNAANFSALAALYARQGRNQLADENYRAALALAPTDADLRYRLGLLELKEHMDAAAVYDFDTALTRTPNDVKIHRSLDIALARFKAKNRVAAAPSAIVPSAVAPSPTAVPSVVVSARPIAVPPAQGNLLVNGSFETGAAIGSWKALQAGSSDIAGWQVVTGRVDYIADYWSAADGTRSIDLDGTPGPGGIAQTFATNPGSFYRVSFAAAGNPDGPPRIKRLRVTVAGQAHIYEFDIAGRSKAAMGWASRSFTFRALGPRATLEFDSLDGQGNWNGPVVDDVAVEPQ